MSFGEFNLDKTKRFRFGRLATLLYIVSLLGLGFIGFSYSLFPEYVTPILLIIVFGLVGIAVRFYIGRNEYFDRSDKTYVIAGRSRSVLVLFSVFRCSQTYLRI